MGYEPFHHYTKPEVACTSLCSCFCNIFSIFFGRFNKTIILLALVGFEMIIANSALCERLFGIYQYHIQRARGIIVFRYTRTKIASSCFILVCDLKACRVPKLKTVTRSETKQKQSEVYSKNANHFVRYSCLLNQSSTTFLFVSRRVASRLLVSVLVSFVLS